MTNKHIKTWWKIFDLASGSSVGELFWEPFSNFGPVPLCIVEIEFLPASTQISSWTRSLAWWGQRVQGRDSSSSCLHWVRSSLKWCFPGAFWPWPNFPFSPHKGPSRARFELDSLRRQNLPFQPWPSKASHGSHTLAHLRVPFQLFQLLKKHRQY